MHISITRNRMVWLRGMRASSHTARPSAGAQVATFERMDTMFRELSQAQLEAEVNTNVVHAVNWAAAQAGTQ